MKHAPEVIARCIVRYDFPALAEALESIDARIGEASSPPLDFMDRTQLTLLKRYLARVQKHIDWAEAAA